LSKLSATELGVLSSVAAIESAKISAECIDETFFGNVIQSSTDAVYLSRHVALKSGVPVTSPSMTINRLCGSGFEAVCLAAEAIELKRGHVMLTGGTENMSQCPMVIDGISARFGTALGKGLKAEDSLWNSLTDAYGGVSMGITAENLADKFEITRAECDAYALRSQQLYAEAHLSGLYSAEISPVTVKSRKGEEVVAADEHPRGDTTIEKLQRLRPVFRPEGGRVTAASASGICDGSASLVVASEAACQEHGLQPLARLVSWARTGCDPSIMGIGPVDAITAALSAASLSLADVELVEINEAFAAQYLACEKALGLDRDRSNLQGGALAVGHPLAASGARILTHLTHELARTGKRYAIGAACIGGGQGIAVLLENAQL
jgi:acetyl-CoA acyltransferase 2